MHSSVKIDLVSSWSSKTSQYSTKKILFLAAIAHNATAEPVDTHKIPQRFKKLAAMNVKKES